MGRPARRTTTVARAPDADPADPRRTRAPSPTGRPTFVTDDTHWWDGSQIYGRDPAFAAARSARASTASCASTRTGCPPSDLEAHVDLTGVAGNFWVGLALLHSLFMREHNAICDHLHAAHPDLSDDELYDKARLVVAALMAKIHTIDWTPAIIAHPTTVTALRTNWWGLEGEWLDKRIGRRTSNEVIRGIPGSPTNHHGVPYALTEEFVCVYRMHPLIPDEFSFRSLDDDAPLQERTLPGDRRAARARAVRRGADGRPALLVRHVTSRRDHAAQLPALPPALRPRRRDAHRPRGDRRPARARARRAALQPVPPAAAPQAVRHVRGDGRHAGARRGAAADLRRRRARRHDGRDVRRAEAEGIRLQRHGVPHLHPDGVAPARERPLLHARLPARGLHARGIDWVENNSMRTRAAAALPGARSRRCRASRTRSLPGSAPPA